MTNPGTSKVSFFGATSPNDKSYNPAAALFKIGKPALSSLAELFEDERPILGYGFHRTSFPNRYVIRYKHVSVQIAEAILNKRQLVDNKLMP